MSTSLVSFASLLDAFNPVAPQVRVAALLVARGQVLLVEHRKRGQRYWVLPGGHLQAGETLTAALRRELKEELGLSPRIGELRVVSEMLAPDRHVVTLIFWSEIGEEAPRLDRQDPVLAGWRWVSPSDLTQLDFRPPIVTAIQDVIAEGPTGPVQMLGDSWRPDAA